LAPTGQAGREALQVALQAAARVVAA